jgi:hypothetical protein
MKQIYIKCILIVSLLLICVLNVILLNNSNIETFDNSTDTPKILYIIRSIPKYYDERLNIQFKTWMKHLNENDDVLVASENKDHIDKFNLKYSTPECPPGHAMGVCCSESNAIVKALKEYEFDWAFILDDDVYVYPDKVRSIISKYKDNYNVALGTPGCESNGVEGFCGGGGYAFSKQALETIVGKDKNGVLKYESFLKEYKISCEKTDFCDITMGELSKKNNIEIIDIPEFKPWGIGKDEKQLIIDNNIATLHYYGGDITKHKKTIEGKMNFLQSLYSQIKEMFTSITERFTNNNSNNNSKADKVVYVFWTGDNPLTKNRKESLETIKKNIGVKVEFVTPKNIDTIIKKEYPLHKAYPYLSLVHKADYLRTYVMHHYGGGYSDIKRTSKDWNTFFDNVNNTDYWGNGSYEHSSGCASVNPEVCKNYKTLYQNCAYIFKPNTPFTKEWIDTLHQKLDEKYELLKQYPATEPREVIGMEKKNKEISKYPLQWAEILGTIFHDICYKYKHKLLYELPPVNTDSYL